MIVRLAMRSLLSRPVRSAVLAGGFGLGVSVMAALLGIGRVILDQARAPELIGGGDVVVGGGASGRVTSARFVLAGVLGTAPLAPRVAAAAPTKLATVYLVADDGMTPIRARGGIPGLERALHDPETSGAANWQDTPADRVWAAPDPGGILRAMDRFHPIPDVPARAASWAEWLYFHGRAGTARFYLSFIAGPRLESGRRSVGVRLQLDRGGRITSYSDAAEIDETALLAAPDMTIDRNQVRLIGNEYRIGIDLPAEAARSRATGQIVVSAIPGRSLPPFAIRGTGGWVSGYTVPVMSGGLDGTIEIDGERLDLRGGTGYHDHNWGFWEGVSWQWGQVQHEGLSIVYGRVRPPEDAADASRIPGFLIAIGPDGPLGYATDVTIEETNQPGTSRPDRIVVRGRGEWLALTMELAVTEETVTRLRPGAFGAGLDFLQLRAEYRVSGRAGETAIEFTAPGSAETFRGRQAGGRRPAGHR
jgi:hypothetical protein